MSEETGESTRSLMAVKIWLAGATYKEVADYCEYSSPAAAKSAIELAVAASLSDEDRKMVRKKISGRLDRLYRALQSKILDEKHPEQIAAIRTAIQINDRYAKLHGADAPTEVSVHTPTMTELERVAAQFSAAQVSALPLEGDVLELEASDGQEQAS